MQSGTSEGIAESQDRTAQLLPILGAASKTTQADVDLIITLHKGFNDALDGCTKRCVALKSIEECDRFFIQNAERNRMIESFIDPSTEHIQRLSTLQIDLLDQIELFLSGDIPATLIIHEYKPE